MPIATRAFEAALRRKGFQSERNTTDKVFYFYYRGLKTHVFTKISHGRSEEIRDKLAGLIKRQMFLETSRQLKEFVDCDLTEEGYIALLASQSIIVLQP